VEKLNGLAIPSKAQARYTSMKYLIKDSRMGMIHTENAFATPIISDMVTAQNFFKYKIFISLFFVSKKFKTNRFFRCFT